MAPAVTENLAEHPNLAWIIAGDGKYRTQLQNDIDDATNSNAVRDRVYILRHVDSIANLYPVADVFLYFSYIDAYPNVILEAQANALPVIANPDHGIVEQITDGETGTFVEMSQFEEARSELRSLLFDESYRRELRTAAAEQVRRENSPEKIGVLFRRKLKSTL